MNNLFLIIALSSLLCACSNQPQLNEERNALLTFSDLATEITVGFEDVDSKRGSVPAGNTPIGTP